jgi:protocatechuate 3,4-dioxygenase beta subunit
MDNDDKQVGRILTRREILAHLGVAGIGAVAARAGGQAIGERTGGVQLPACVVRPQQTEGPYFTDVKLNRGDIRSDPGNGAVREGVPLDLAIRVSRVTAGRCAVLAGAMVDVWQCDALGVYSDVRDMNALFDTRGQKWLRGFQRTDAGGLARFTTIYPGWYQGRTTHIHFKVRALGEGRREYEFTSQLYFDDAQSDAIFSRPPYASNKQRRVRNDGDGIFRRGGGQLLVPLEKRGEGYAGVFDLGLQI